MFSFVPRFALKSVHKLSIIGLVLHIGLFVNFLLRINRLFILWFLAPFASSFQPPKTTILPINITFSTLSTHLTTKTTNF